MSVEVAVSIRGPPIQQVNVPIVPRAEEGWFKVDGVIEMVIAREAFPSKIVVVKEVHMTDPVWSIYRPS